LDSGVRTFQTIYCPDAGVAYKIGQHDICRLCHHLYALIARKGRSARNAAHRLRTRIWQTIAFLVGNFENIYSACSLESLNQHAMDTDAASECHPAALAAMAAFTDNTRFQTLLRSGVASAYPLGRDDFHLPPHTIRGRPGEAGGGHGHFTGWIDAITGRLRVDHTHAHAFWLEVDLEELMEAYLALKYQPGGPSARAAVRHAEALAAQHARDEGQAGSADDEE
jgi:hypothetical protein